MYARRDLSAFGFPLNTLGTVANATLDFVPSGAPVTQVRDVVATAACNQCHDPLAVHGGARQDVQLCILCHNPGNADPYTGNSLDFKVFIHKIHMGANKPSESGKPLNILGTSGRLTATPRNCHRGHAELPSRLAMCLPERLTRSLGSTIRLVTFPRSSCRRMSATAPPAIKAARNRITGRTIPTARLAVPATIM